MPRVLVISSHVSASGVGGGLAPVVLGAMGIECILVPTTLLGRHPGLGSPGGGPVDAELMAGILEGVEASGAFGRVDAVLTGYFAEPAQVDVAARAIDSVRGAWSGGEGPLVVVDPIMGDRQEGLFVKEEIALAIAQALVPRADLVACNHWEFERLTRTAPELADVIEAGQAAGGDWLVSSVPFGERIADVLVSRERVYAAASDIVPPPIPKGTGDLFRLVFLGQRLLGFGEADALHKAIGLVDAALRISRARNETDLRPAALGPLLSDPPMSGYVIPIADES